MGKTADFYTLKTQQSKNELTFIFVSQGRKNILKAVQYSLLLAVENFPIKELTDKIIYNFGFGDYDIHADTIADDVNSNNGDVYKIFNTVLSTIPLFFNNHINDALIVQGSDEGNEFIKTCKLSCAKKCDIECKKQSRRIKIYRNYRNKNYNDLIVDYHFFGGKTGIDMHIFLEEYMPGEKYDSILLIKKKV